MDTPHFLLLKKIWFPHFNTVVSIHRHRSSLRRKLSIFRSSLAFVTMHFTLLYAIVQISFLFRSLTAIDPFEGNFPTLHCLEPAADVTGCNENLLDAYKRTEASKSDKNINNADTFFYLFTCRNRKKPEFLHRCGGSLPKGTTYTAGNKTAIIVPGYISYVCGMAFLQEIKDQLLCRGICNVILIDWPWGNFVDYHSASRNTRVVGKHIAFVIKNIINQIGDSGNNFHCIGHSLGAHICAFAGKELQKAGITMRRITGLDPAGVDFYDVEPSDRLTKSDAGLVDIIHSNAGKCFPLALGYLPPMGHADFYPNGGSVQLSCYTYILTSLLKHDFYYAFVNLLGPFCPHFQSVQYFKESINACECQFVGVECKSYADFKLGKCRSCGDDGSKCAVMGLDCEEYYIEKSGSHSYYLDTGLSCPHCKKKQIDLQGFLNSTVDGDRKRYCFVPGRETCS